MKERIIRTNEHSLPLIPIRGMCIFPDMVIHFDVGREKSIRALEEAMVGDQLIFLVTQKDFEEEDPGQDDIYEIGTIAKIKQLLKMPGNIIRVLVEGESRGRIKRITQETPFFKADIEETIFELAKGKEVDALSHMIMDIFQDYMKLSRKVSPETLLTISNMEDYGKVADIIAGNIDLKLEEQQEILEILPPYERLEFLYGKLIQEMKF